MLLLGILSYESFVRAALQFVDTVLINIASAIYNVISMLYQVFMALASAQIFGSDEYQKIANNFYAVIGVVALFLVSYALLRAIIDPDGSSKGEYAVAKIIPNVIKTILLIAFVPTLFSIAYNVQNVVIKTNVIPKIILGASYDGKSGNGIGVGSKELSFKAVGKETANLMFKAFLYPSDGESEEGIEVSECYTSLNACPEQLINHQAYSFAQASHDVEEVENGNDIDFNVYANFANKIHSEKPQLEYNGIFQIIAGVFAAYIFLNYCIDIGVRCVKLGYYQIIAPLPILTILIPGQNKIFNNWLKSTLSTFADIFIKISIIFFGLLLIKNMPSFKGLWSDSIFGTPSAALVKFSQVFLIIGILIFMKQAPKLLSDLFGISSGSFKLGIKDKIGEMVGVGGLAKDTLSSVQGAATGALGAAWTSKMNGGGFFAGGLYGAAAGWRDGKSNPHQFGRQRQDLYTKMGYKGAAGFFGGQAFMDKKLDDVRNKYTDDYKDRILSERVNAASDYTDPNSMIYPYYEKARDAAATRYAELTATKNDEIKEALRQYEGAREEGRHIVDEARNAFEHSKTLQVDGIQAQRVKAEAEFDAKKQSTIANIQTKLKSGGVSDSERAQLYKELKEAQASKFDGSTYDTKISNVMNSKFENTSQYSVVQQRAEAVANEAKQNLEKLEKEKQDLVDAVTKSDGATITKHVYDPDSKKLVKKEFKVSQLEKDAYEQSIKDLKDADETFKNREKAFTARVKEKENEAWLNTDEGQHMNLIFGKNAEILSGKNSGDKK